MACFALNSFTSTGFANEPEPSAFLVDFQLTTEVFAISPGTIEAPMELKSRKVPQR